MNERRRELVGMAYDVLDRDGSGQVTRADIEMAYDASQHPEVIEGKKSPDEVISSFMAQWETDEADGIVTRSEFEQYYEDVSASIDDDTYFELMIRNAWHIMGGEGAAANSSNLRVLVTHSNGEQEVVPIMNDLGVDPEDVETLLTLLEAQGVTDIDRIDTAY